MMSDYYIYKMYGNADIVSGELSPFDVGDLGGVVARVVSNYENLSIAENKRICRFYLDVQSKYQTFGNVSVEPDYFINNHVHTDGEASEPDSSVSRQTFVNSGEQSWNTSDDFDGTVEAWNRSRLDIGTEGSSFRYSITAGDVKRANHNIMRIRPPKIDVQIKGKY